MANDAPTCRRLALEVKRRAFVSRLLSWSGRLLIAASALCLSWVLFDKLVSTRLSTTADLSAVAIGGFAIALSLSGCLAWKSRLSDAQAALIIDERMSSKDAISTALSIPEGSDPDAARLVISRAEVLAAGCRSSTILPLSCDRSWYCVAGLMLATLISARFVPSLATDLGSRPIFEKVESDQARQAIAQATAELQSVPDAVDAQTQSELVEIERELLGERENPGEALQQVADALDRAADRREQEAARERDADDRLREALQAARKSNEKTGSELAQAVEEADFDRAVQKARELEESQRQMTEDERREVSEELERLADSLDQITREKPQTPEQQQSADSDADRSNDNQSVKDMSEALKDAARQLREPQQDSSSSQEGSQDDKNQNREERSDRRDSEATDQDPASDRNSDSRQRQEQSGQQQSDQSRQSGETRESQSGREEQSQSGQRQESARQEGQQQNTDTGAEQRREQNAAEGQSAEQGGERNQSADQKQGQQGQSQQNGMRRLAERLKQAAERGDKSEQHDATAERLRQRADDMRGASTPTQQQELRELKERMGRAGRDQKAPGQSAGEQSAQGPKQAQSTSDSYQPERLESVDARPNEVDPNVRRRMLSEIEGSGDGGATADVQWRRSVEEAAKGAEKAIERRGVPRERRDFVRRVFQRYVDRAKVQEQTAPARPAEDVPAGGGR